MLFFIESISDYFVIPFIIALVPALITGAYLTKGKLILNNEKIIAEKDYIDVSEIKKITFSVSKAQTPSLKKPLTIYKLVSFYKWGFCRMIIEKNDASEVTMDFLVQNEKHKDFFHQYVQRLESRHSIKVVDIPFKQPCLFSRNRPRLWRVNII